MPNEPSLIARVRPSGICTRAPEAWRNAVVPVTVPLTAARESGGKPSATASSASRSAKSILTASSGIGPPLAP